MVIKICTKCRVEKEASLFHKNKKTKDGCNRVCARCCNKAYHATPNKTEVRKKWYHENKKQARENHSKWLDENKIANNERDRIYRNERYKTDIQFRLKLAIRNRTKQVLKGKNKSERTLNLLGCSFDELQIYFEQQFTKGMTWENYGQWHIDHIRPCANFDLSDSDQQKQCFHYTNLQPLWALDNLLKSNKYEAMYS